MTAAPPLIQASGLTVEIDGSPILAGIDLILEPGEVVAVLGPNGSGKSTLVRALLGVVPTAGGAVRLFGQHLSRQVPWHRIGYVPQRSSASSGVPATAAEVVASGTLSGRRLRPPRGHKAAAGLIMAALGLEQLAGIDIATLSGGQAQRVWLARALVRDPALLILDEPTAGVDLVSQTAFADLLATRRASQPGLAILVVLHELGSFGGIITRTVRLEAGRIVYDGPPPAQGPGCADEHDHLHPHGPTTADAAHTPGLEIRP